MTTIDSNTLVHVTGGTLLDKLGRGGGFLEVIPGPGRRAHQICGALSLAARTAAGAATGWWAAGMAHAINRP